MAIQEDIHWKLSKLKDAISKSSNIKSEVKDLLEKVTPNDIGAEVSRLSKDEVFRLYQLRSHFIESKGNYNESFANLLNRLEDVDSSLQVVITLLQAQDKSYIVFTDKDYCECFGAIY